MIDFHDKRDFVSVFTSHGPEYSECRCHGVTPALDSKFYDVFRIKIERIRGERRSCRVFNSLIHGENGHVAAICQTTVTQDALQTVQCTGISIG